MAARKKREADPPTQVEALARALAGGAEPKRLYVFRGEERYFREAAIRLVQERCASLGHEVVQYSTKDPDFDAGRLNGDLSGGSLFAAARCIVVRDATPLLKKEGREQGPFVRAALAGSSALQCRCLEPCRPSTACFACLRSRASSTVATAW